jgi:hypothetical protein
VPEGVGVDGHSLEHIRGVHVEALVELYAGSLPGPLTLAAPAFSYLRPIEDGNERMVDQTGASWNLIRSFLQRTETLRRAA